MNFDEYIGGYKVIDYIASGGFGSAFLVENE